MSFRCAMRWTQQAGDKLSGWSENFWNLNSDLSATSALALTLAKLLDAAKGRQVYQPTIRISQSPGFRVVSQIRGASQGPGTTATADGDYPSSALLLRMTAPGPYVTNQWIRGIPDGVVTLGGTYTPSGVVGFQAALNAFIAALTSGSNGWALRTLSVAVAPTVITAINLATGIVTSAGHGIPPNQQRFIRVKGYQIPRGLNKIWLATGIDASTLQLNYYVPPASVTQAYGRQPTARIQTYTYTQIATANVIRATSHYTGKPTGLLGGRRRGRRTSPPGSPVAP